MRSPELPGRGCRHSHEAGTKAGYTTHSVLDPHRQSTGTGSGQVGPRHASSSQPSDPCRWCLGLPDLTRQETTWPDILGHILGHLQPIGVRHPGTSKPPAAFPLAGGPSSVSTQNAPEGIRTPNLLIRSNSIDPTPTEAARPEKKPGQMFAQVTGMRTRQGRPGRGVTEPRSRRILGHVLGHLGRLRRNPGGVGTRPRWGLSTSTWSRALGGAVTHPAGRLATGEAGEGAPGRSIRAYPR